MAEACYTARATTKQQVLDGINKLTLQTNKHGQYTHNAILLLQKGVQQVLISQFNPSDPGKGMVKLLDNGANILMQVKLIDAITAGSVLKTAKKQADELTTTTGKTILPTFTTQMETGGSQPFERHQSIGHWHKGWHHQGLNKTNWQRHHQRHPTNG
jgi:hypothetical protein